MRIIHLGGKPLEAAPQSWCKLGVNEALPIQKHPGKMTCDKEPSHSLFTTLEPVVRIGSCACIYFPPLCFREWRSHAAHTVRCLAENHTSELFSTTEIQSGLDNTWTEPGFSSLWAVPYRNNLNCLSWKASLRLMGQEHLSTRITPLSLLLKSSNQNLFQAPTAVFYT